MIDNFAQAPRFIIKTANLPILYRNPTLSLFGRNSFGPNFGIISFVWIENDC